MTDGIKLRPIHSQLGKKQKRNDNNNNNKQKLFVREPFKTLCVALHKQLKYKIAEIKYKTKAYNKNTATKNNNPSKCIKRQNFI